MKHCIVFWTCGIVVFSWIPGDICSTIESDQAVLVVDLPEDPDKQMALFEVSSYCIVCLLLRVGGDRGHLHLLFHTTEFCLMHDENGNHVRLCFWECFRLFVRWEFRLTFHADIRRKPASPARRSRQRLHAVFASDAYMPANETADGTTWQRLYEAWQPSMTSWPQWCLYL